MPGVHEEVQHPHLEARVVLEPLLVEGDDLVLPHSQPAGVVARLRRLFRRHPDPELRRHFELVLVEAQLLLVVEDGDDVLESVVEEIHDVLLVLEVLEAVAEDDDVLLQVPRLLQGLDDGHVEGRRGLELDSGPERLRHDVLEVRALGAVAVGVAPAVVVLGDGALEIAPRRLDLVGDDREIGEAKRGLVGLDELHHVDAVKVELVVEDLEALGEVVAVG